MRIILFIISGFFYLSASSQEFKLYGRVLNSKQEPLAFASVQVKEFHQGSITKEDGSYELKLEPGNYELVISMVGYKVLVMPVIIKKEPSQLDFILEAEVATLIAVTIKGKFKDRAEDYIRNVIRNKDSIAGAAGAYSCKVYIKAVQEDSSGSKKPAKAKLTDTLQANKALNQVSFAEIVLRLDRKPPKETKEERLGISKKGNAEQLFYLSTTEGDFNFYNNLVYVPGISSTTFLSPFSYSGLMAYRFKTVSTATINSQKIYTISIRPRQMSNATVEGEVTIAEGSWAILHTKLRFPKYHLAGYDFFEVEQQYERVAGKAWMLNRQEFTYRAQSGKRKSSGHTLVTYQDYVLNKKFDKKYFGTEVSSASAKAYEQDSSFWVANRTEPLTEKELRVIHYRDSIYRATHTKAYLDSVDRVINRITWQKVLYKGQDLNNHEKRSNWNLPSLLSLYQPIQFGGTRIQPMVGYSKTFPSRKNIYVFTELSFGLRNKDLNGALRATHLYNPLHRGYIYATAEKNFEYIFSGDAWINMIKRSNVYLHEAIGVGHSVEVANGLYVFTNADMAFRRSVSDYKTNERVDSLFGSVLDNNIAVSFPSYNALYARVRVEYTPHQRYIREPKEKVILGSVWPTFYVLWKKGIPGVFGSKINFDYLELAIQQSVKLGIMGNSSYTVRTGSFFNQKDLRLVDYKYQRRGDPLLFLNPNEAFQSLDSTFPVFSRFYEGHYLHEFNGALLNKIPFFKKIGLREVAGAGFLIAKERNLRYGELFTGVERIFKFPFNQVGKFKLGVYVVGSVANQFNNPVQFKVGITTWDKRKGKWF
ncbi:MAG: DUF5686 and carboxypeptidase regulatory-like domain-containing protein [Bacteroidetes bacterium]|nr:DUF5686 and carboxypeptidase regulatory-like domain-containing protein [Bacteroidota bacterium]